MDLKHILNPSNNDSAQLSLTHPLDADMDKTQRKKPDQRDPGLIELLERLIQSAIMDDLQPSLEPVEKANLRLQLLEGTAFLKNLQSSPHNKSTLISFNQLEGACKKLKMNSMCTDGVTSAKLDQVIQDLQALKERWQCERKSRGKRGSSISLKPWTASSSTSATVSPNSPSLSSGRDSRLAFDLVAVGLSGKTYELPPTKRQRRSASSKQGLTSPRPVSGLTKRIERSTEGSISPGCTAENSVNSTAGGNRACDEDSDSSASPSSIRAPRSLEETSKTFCNSEQ
ncbi:hypothetical protein NliqN6_6676 [Naganishia liquefaciens]|uniref:Uncharacterized protein n=1 Tax=Naganishia liquefaciens TaxID=104408 RepID=A0A8H3U1V6_9TREE|nr:hypothetical protein NliqN6_6676 [Naganishia liquefaciens]